MKDVSSNVKAKAGDTATTTVAAPASTTETPATTTVVAPASTTVATTGAKKPRVAPQVLAISNAVAMPTSRSSARGSKSLYDFDSLQVGQSIPVKNKTAHDLSSVVSAQNRKKSNYAQKMENGVPVFVVVPVKDATGVVVGHNTTSTPVMEQIKVFFAHDCEKDDPEGATVRIWRSK